jgi:hypothetical protein
VPWYPPANRSRSSTQTHVTDADRCRYLVDSAQRNERAKRDSLDSNERGPDASVALIASVIDARKTVEPTTFTSCAKASTSAPITP